MPIRDDEGRSGTSVIYIRVPEELHHQFFVRLAIEGRSATEVGEQLIRDYLQTPPRPRKRKTHLK